MQIRHSLPKNYHECCFRYFSGKANTCSFMAPQYVSFSGFNLFDKLSTKVATSAPGLKAIIESKTALKNGCLSLWKTPLFPWITDMPCFFASPQLLPYMQWSGRKFQSQVIMNSRSVIWKLCVKIITIHQNTYLQACN